MINRRNFLSFLPTFGLLSSPELKNKEQPAHHLNEVKYFIKGEWVSTYRIWDWRKSLVFTYRWDNDEFISFDRITKRGVLLSSDASSYPGKAIIYYNEKTNIRMEVYLQLNYVLKSQASQYDFPVYTVKEQLLINILNNKNFKHISDEDLDPDIEDYARKFPYQRVESNIERLT